VSGAVLDPIALHELFPDWQKMGAPLHTPVSEDVFSWFSKSRAWHLPSWLLPPMMRNHGNFIISLGDLCRWLAEQAEALGVEIYAGFAAQHMLYDDKGQVVGVLTGDMGLDAQGHATPQYTAGIEIRAPFTLLAEGARGSLTRELEQHFDLRPAAQKYGLGLKEVWRVAQDQHQVGRVQHSLGWPLSDATGGGGFIYHYGEQLVSIGMVVHLDYANPHLSPYEEFQRFKTHPAIKALLKHGKRLSFGARAISEGGIQSLPQLIFPGGALLGCSAGMVNVPRIKGSHNAMKSGMLAAEALIKEWLQPSSEQHLLHDYPKLLAESWLWQDLHQVRNIKPMLSRWGTLLGTVLGGMEMWLAAAKIGLPWTLPHSQADHVSLRPASEMPVIAYPKPDGEFSFDRLTSISLSNIAHDCNQPCHLHLKNQAIPIRFNLPEFNAPEQRYCPAGVYEIVQKEGVPYLQINAQNCIHCKTCDIKDPSQNIVWTPAEGGSGPNYSGM
jgi:electron-transferring-flavoprotein dehydrogenase